MNIVRGNQSHPGSSRQLGESVVTGRVLWLAVVPELDHDLVRTKYVNQFIKATRCRPGSFAQQRSIQWPFATPREHQELSAVVLSEIDKMDRACSLRSACQIGLG